MLKDTWQQICKLKSGKERKVEINRKNNNINQKAIKYNT